MLLKGPNELLYVDTIDKIGRWEIDLFGVDAPRTVTLEQARVACRNAVAWISDRFASELHSSEVRGVYGMDVIKKSRSVDGEGVTTAEFWVNGRQVSSCRFSHKYWSKYSHASADANIETEAVSGSNRAWMIYPPTTKLSSLARN